MLASQQWYIFITSFHPSTHPFTHQPSRSLIPSGYYFPLLLVCSISISLILSHQTIKQAIPFIFVEKLHRNLTRENNFIKVLVTRLFSHFWRAVCACVSVAINTNINAHTSSHAQGHGHVIYPCALPVRLAVNLFICMRTPLTCFSPGQGRRTLNHSSGNYFLLCDVRLVAHFASRLFVCVCVTRH